MTNLLSAYFSRLWKDKFFWLAMLFMAGLGVFLTLNQYNSQQLLQRRDLAETASFALEDYCFSFQWVIGGVAALTSSLFLGREYQDGTLRNKLIAGHSRTAVYLAGLGVNIFFSLLLCASCFLFSCAIGIPTMGGFEAPAKTILLLCLGNLLAVVAYCSLFTLIEMLSSSQTSSIILTMLVFLGMLALSVFLIGRLTVFQTMVNLLPTGQAFSLAGGGDEFLPWLPLYSAGLIALTTLIGILGFRKKDIV